MSSKLDYLKKYVSRGEILPGEPGYESKKKKKRKKVKASSNRGGGNFAIVDDDVDWRSLVPLEKPAGSDDEDDPEDKPIVAEVNLSPSALYIPAQSVNVCLHFRWNNALAQPMTAKKLASYYERPC